MNHFIVKGGGGTARHSVGLVNALENGLDDENVEFFH